jgi:SAM-dependent methyltransferase
MRAESIRAARTILVLVSAACAAHEAEAQDVPFLETPEAVVEAMLDLAAVGPDDVVYDLGSGDGRIVIAAARRGARGVGVESDPALVTLSGENAVRAGVADRVEFRGEDLFTADVGDATVVAIYLNPKVNRRLGPHLVALLAPGTRVVSHKYEIPGWEPERRVKAAGRTLFLYRVADPARAGGP